MSRNRLEIVTSIRDRTRRDGRSTLVENVYAEIGTDPDLEVAMISLAADAFAEHFPEHVGIGLHQAVITGLPDIHLSGRDVSTTIARHL